jgi:Rab GDP dissociation inhibitor
MDRNSYYGGESASLNLEQLWRKFKHNDDDTAKVEVPKEFGRTRDYCVDLCPKFLMACGDLVKVLLTTKVTRYLDFKSISGSFVWIGKNPSVQKVPATASEALNSSIMGIFQKRRFKNFLNHVNEWDENDSKTWRGKDLTKVTAREFMKWWKLEDQTMTFVGHAMCLYTDDSYLDQPAKPMVERIKLYAYSVSRYGSSPYIYPIWGLGGLPEGFSRLCAIHGGVYMLNKPIKQILYNDDGTVRGVQDMDGKEAYCKQLIADPSYFAGTDKVKKVGQVARSICILNHPVPGATNTMASCQIILPTASSKRKHDIYIAVVSYDHKVAANGQFVAILSTKMQGDGTDAKAAEAELKQGIDLLGPVMESFCWVTDLVHPVNDSKKDNCFISKSFDETTHFQSATEEVIAKYKDLTGQDLDLTISADPSDLQDDGQ